MNTENLFEKLEKSGYHGIDISLEISLLEYGLLIKERPGDILVISAVTDFHYDITTTTIKEINNIVNDSWFNKISFFSFIGCADDKEWSEINLSSKIHSLLQYYGYQNIFDGEPDRIPIDELEKFDCLFN